MVSDAAPRRLRSFRYCLVKMKQQLYLDSRLGQSLGAGTLFWLQDPIVLQSPRYTFTLSVPFVARPLTHCVITPSNRTLDISYTNLTSIIELPLGNHSMALVIGPATTCGGLLGVRAPETRASWGSTTRRAE